MANRSTGAARYFTEQQLGGPTRTIPSNPNIQTSVTQVCNNNPDRVGLVVVNLGSFDVFVWTDNSVSTTKGVRLTANGGVMTLNVKDDYTLVAEQWIGIGSGGAALLGVLEVVSDVILPPETH